MKKKKKVFILPPWRPWPIEFALLTFSWRCRDFLSQAQRFVLGAFSRTSAIENGVFSSGAGSPSSHPPMQTHAHRGKWTFRSQTAVGRFSGGAAEIEIRRRTNARPCATPEMTNETIKHLTWADKSDLDSLIVHIFCHSRGRNIIHPLIWQSKGHIFHHVRRSLPKWISMSASFNVGQDNYK